MAGENPTEPTQDHKPETKANPKSGPRRPRSSPEGPEAAHAEGDEPETESAGTTSEKKVEESHGTHETMTATHKPGPIPVETKRTPPVAGEQPKAVPLAERMRFSRRIKPRR